ncbi:uncharacterized protein LOC133315448 [Gastrolobium bilobum]|uniref:uncharacterized protein LOC133315448 n=1 Tax=Gastrolobium bilobum TaxID=150636 RepID=UPI002AB0F971|nr:uncharacterized protein LOC133315448 [Gastrolobium bilobum]
MPEDDLDPKEVDGTLDEDVPVGNKEEQPNPEETLIVKLLAKKLSVSFMKKRLENMWAREGKILVTDVENDFIFVRFEKKEDMNFALLAGPWSIFGHYLAIRRWEPDFHAMQTSIGKITAWIRLPGFPIEYVNTSLMKSLGDWVGTFIKLDSATTNLARGKFARICVELDLSQPLKAEYYTDGKYKQVKYEGLHLVCFGCGRYGHNVDACPSAVKSDQIVSIDDESICKESQEKAYGGGEAEVQSFNFGPWKVVSRTKKGKPNSHRGGAATNTEEKQDKKKTFAVAEPRASQEKDQSEGKSSQKVMKNNTSKEKEQHRTTNHVQARSNAHKEKVQLVETESAYRLVRVNLAPPDVMVIDQAPKPPDPASTQTMEYEAAGDRGQSNDEFIVQNQKMLLGAAKAKLGHSLKLLVDKHESCIVMLMETRTPSVNSTKIMKKLCFDKIIFEEANGFAGGIWVMWNSNKARVDSICQESQFIHMNIEVEGIKKFVCTAVYASPHEGTRHDMWEKASYLSQSINEPWIMASDFNDIKCSSEKKGGTRPDLAKCLRFQSFLDNCQVRDVDVNGAKFTWQGPKWNNLDRVYKKLDIKCANLQWTLEFGDATAQTLPRVLSDHNPLLLKLEKQSQHWQHRPFRFMATWMDHPSFDTLMEDKWNKTEEISRMLPRFVPHLHKWKREKSRQKWIDDGDKNTRFYHLKTVLHRSSNKILKLKDELQQWIENPNELKQHVCQFYSQLFCEEITDKRWLVSEKSWPRLSMSELNNMSITPTNQEIMKCVFSMGAFKAPGSDEFPAVFYQRQWNQIKGQVCKTVKDLWCTPKRIAEVNHTLLVLIPKTKRPESITQFRPISLCSVLYKILSKFIVGRLKPVMEKIISPSQVSLVPNRQIQDNIIIVQELVHSMSKMRGRKAFIAIKIDLVKAYERVSWQFMKKTLEEIHILDVMVKLIMHCVSSSTINVLSNGGKTHDFFPSRGLQQGDPLSSYLFVMAMEKLTHITDIASNGELWKPMRVGKNGLRISHVAFADDLMVFMEASEEQIHILLKCLSLFEEMSGQKLSVDKTSVFFSKNTSEENINKIVQVSGFKRVKNIGRYLGSMMQHGRVKRSLYDGIVDRVKEKLSNWERQCLSQAGRITLAQSVMTTIPFFQMQSCMLPMSVCDDIERMQRRIIWGDSDIQKKNHLISWDVITLPKECGGLGFKKLNQMNYAFLAKRA